MRSLSSRKELRMSEKIVKQIRASVGYLSDLKANSSLEIQKVVDFLFEAAFFNKSDSYFTNIVDEDKHNSEEYQFFDGHWYKKTENGHYRGYHGKYIHQAVWEHFNGEIPKGYIIHHIDGDKSNNEISNLQLMTQSEHKKLHMDVKKYVCSECGKEFTVYNYSKTKYCSRECVEKARARKNNKNV